MAVPGSKSPEGFCTFSNSLTVLFSFASNFSKFLLCRFPFKCILRMPKQPQSTLHRSHLPTPAELLTLSPLLSPPLL
uniref:Putative ovule protein n=1 Tax=Solanum chacoense TaxID=4108 RepID=A0A0V0GMS1_SOLCH